MELNITGPFYDLPHRDLNHQKCINMYPTTGDPVGRTQVALVPTPGLKELVDVGGNETRALVIFGSQLFTVVDDGFYEITVNVAAQTATSTLRGTLTSISGRISWDVNATQIILVDGVRGYIYTPSTEVFAEITDVDLQPPKTVVFVDSYFIYNKTNSSRMLSSAQNDGTTWAAVDIATAEGKPDLLVGLALDKNELWVFGEHTIEIWFDAANPTGFPFSKRGSAFIDQGCAAAFSIVNFDNTLIWLDERGYVSRSNGYGIQVISNEAIGSEIQRYDVIDDAFAFTYFNRGHLNYVITFPTEDITWVFDALTQQWYQWSHFSEDDKHERHLANCHAYFERLNIVGSFKSGKLYVLSSDYFDDDGDAIIRVRTTPFLHAENIFIGIDTFDIHMTSGKALVTGQGSDPQIMLRYSHDGGFTWSNELWRSVGKIGEYGTQVRWNRLGTGREWIFELTFSEPCDFSIMDASILIAGERGDV